MNLRSGRLLFQVQGVDAPATVTAHAGLPLVIEAFRTLGLAAGGECVDDVRVLHADAGLLRLWGRKALPAAETLRAFLKRFHDEVAVAVREPHTAFIP